MGDRKVILIKGDGSKWYDEVIFIVKNNAEVPTSPVMEAEKIVRNYIASRYSNMKYLNKKNDVKKDKKVSNINNAKINKAIDICLILVLIALAILVFLSIG